MPASPSLSTMTRATLTGALARFLPPPDLSLSQWADEHYHLPPEKGGKWKTIAYQRAIMDALTDLDIEEITVMKSARVGFTQILIALILYHMHHDPCSGLIVQPTVEDAEGFSKEDLAPAIERHHILDGIVSSPTARDGSNTILAKHYLGRTLWMVGANSGRGFRRIHARYSLNDEVDGYPLSAGTEGAPLDLSYRRTQEAHFGRKFVKGSTPTNKGTSVIEASFQQSNQQHYYVPCPHCRHEQRLQWGTPDTDFGIKWPKGKPEEAAYLCEKCHVLIDENRKPWMIDRGDWVAHAPKVKHHRGFHIWAGYSLSPNASWGTIAREYVEVHDKPLRLKTWINTVRGEAYEDPRDRIPSHELESRREEFAKDEAGRPMVPEGALVLTAGVDVQHDRIEARVDAWGDEYECWQLEYHVLYGDPSAAAIWKDLDELLLRPRQHVRGVEMFIRATGVDTSDRQIQAATNYCRPRLRRMLPNGQRAFVFALKGAHGQKRSIWPQRANTTNVGKVNLFIVGVDAAKEAIYSRLRVEKPGPGFFHFPMERGSAWFEQHTAEEKGYSLRRGVPVPVWKPRREGARNEALDTAVYSLAAYEGLLFHGLQLDEEKRRFEKATRTATTPKPKAERAPETPAPAPRVDDAPPERSDWIDLDRSNDWLRR